MADTAYDADRLRQVCLIPDFDGSLFSLEWKDALRYGPDSARERHHDSGGALSDAA
jgi:hypothetical protein